MEPEQLAEHGGVRHTDAARADQVRRHLDDARVFALERQIIGDLAAGQAAADDDDVVTGLRFAVQIVDSGDGLLRAGHRQRPRGSTDGHDHQIRVQRVHVGDFRIHVDRCAALLQFAGEPFQYIAVFFLEGGRGRRVEHAAEPVSLLVEVDPVSACRCLDGHFHAAESAADDGDLFRVLRGTFLVDGLVVGPGVQHALAHFVVQDIDVRALAVHAVEDEAGAVAGDARTDVLGPPFFDLGHVLGIAQ